MSKLLIYEKYRISAKIDDLASIYGEISWILNLVY